MKKNYLLLFVLFLSFSAFSQQLINANLVKSYSKSSIDSILTANGIPAVLMSTKFAINVYKVSYNAHYVNDSLVPVSGLMVLPDTLGCSFPLFLYNHGTISKKIDAPSNLRSSEPIIAFVMASNGYASVEPDYFGLGDGDGLHPYQHRETEAMAAIDLLRSCREYCAANSIDLNGQLFITGYSQGGHAAMATHRRIELSYSSEFQVTASSPMSGAYDMSGTMVDVMLSDDPYPAPSYLPYLVLGWNPIYNLYADISDAFRPPYDSTIPPLFDGTKGLGTIESYLPSVPKLIFDSLELISFTNDSNHVFRLALKDNDTWRDWVPQAPMQMVYCQGDRSVSYLNSMVAYQHFTDAGCSTCDTVDVGISLDHGDCIQYAIFNTKSYFDSFKTNPCISGIEDMQANNLKLYPSPASSTLYIENDDATKNDRIQIVDVQGNNVKEVKLLFGVNSVDISTLNNGMYFVVSNHAKIKFIKTEN